MGLGDGHTCIEINIMAVYLMYSVHVHVCAKNAHCLYMKKHNYTNTGEDVVLLDI